MNTDALNEARRELADVVEELGAVAMHLREAIDFAETNLPQAVGSVEDAGEAIAAAIDQLHKINDRSGRWVVWAEGESAPEKAKAQVDAGQRQVGKHEEESE